MTSSESNLIACWVSCNNGRLSGRFFGKTSTNYVITWKTSRGIRVLSFGKTLANSVIKGVTSKRIIVLFLGKTVVNSVIIRVSSRDIGVLDSLMLSHSWSLCQSHSLLVPPPDNDFSRVWVRICYMQILIDANLTGLGQLVAICT